MVINYKDVIPQLKQHILADGFHLVLDHEKSHGSVLVNGVDGKEYLDFFSFFASLPLGFNHPKINNPEFHKRILPATLCKPTNSDVYSIPFA